MSYCDCDMDDYDPPVFGRVSNIRAARRQHKCVECGGAILVGEPYQRVEGKWDAGVEVICTCYLCLAARSTCLTIPTTVLCAIPNSNRLTG